MMGEACLLRREAEHCRPRLGQSFPRHTTTRYASEHKRLVEALSELRNLVEEYSPSWYTEEHHRESRSRCCQMRSIECRLFSFASNKPSLKAGLVLHSEV